MLVEQPQPAFVRLRADAKADDIHGAQRQGAMRNAISVGGHLVAGLAAAAAAELGQLRVDVREREDVRLDHPRLAQPRPLSVHFQPQRPEMAGFAKVIAGQRFVVAALPAAVHDEQRRPFPGIELSLPDER
jgi:hypothetical protein